MTRKLRERLYRAKIALVAVVSAIVGVLLQLLAKHAVGRDGPLSWLAFLPLSEIGATLFAAGLFGIVWEYFDGQDKEARENERIRRLLAESAPAMRDAVVRGFAVEPADLERVATPKLLDDIATNVLALRLGDRQFAQEIYGELRDQAIRAPERWHDVEISVRLSSARKRDGVAIPLFDVFVEWQYSTVPTHPI